MGSILFTALVVMLTLGAIAYIVEKRNASDDRDAPPVYSLLPGDIKYESPDGSFRFYFPVMTSVVLSIVLTIVLGLFS